jgi:prophage regulatory protein
MISDTFRQAQSDKALARRRQVESLVQLSRSSIYAGIKAGTFPAPYRIGARAVAWRVSEIEQWLEARPLASTTA